MESHEQPHLPHFHLHFPKIRVPVKRSEKYKFSGTGSYLYALRKYNFNPPYGPPSLSVANGLGVRGKFSSMNSLVLLFVAMVKPRLENFLLPMFKMTPCTFVLLQLAKARMQ
jgi:hypothetical protein